MDPERVEKNIQVVYCSHGGGPLPILGDPGHQAMVDFMTRLPEQLNRPEAIIVISAHWEESVATLTGARYCHPREEHLLPLHVCFGLADGPARVVFDDQILGKRGVAFLWT